jgi:hypothetical protein
MRKSEVCSNIVHYIRFVIHLRIADLSFFETNEVEVDQVLSLVVYLHLAIYLAIVGGKTRFRPGNSSRAQRGWFVSWAVIGIVYGALFSAYAKRTVDNKARSVTSVALVLVAFIFGAATIGGVVAMVQQYLQFVEC